jgi:hypothetical protein
VELIILIFQIEEIALVESEGVHWNIRNPGHDCTMVKAWWHDFESTMVWTWNNNTMVKQQWYDGETTNAQWWKRDGTKVKTRCYDWGKYDGTMMKLRWHDDETAILLSSSWFHHRAMLFHHCVVVFSASYHRAFTIEISCKANTCYLCPNGTP